MPNFVIEHSGSLAQQIDADSMMDKVFEGAKDSGHFPPEAIKIRVEPRPQYRLHDKYKDFCMYLHTFLVAAQTNKKAKFQMRYLIS